MGLRAGGGRGIDSGFSSFGGKKGRTRVRPVKREGIYLMRSIFSLVYVVVGFFVASANDYVQFDTLNAAFSFLLALLLWPLIFFGVDLRF